MDIIQRNFLRLLRCGAFDKRERIEPMSEWKWNRLYKLSQIHGVTPWISDGIHKCSDDFFLKLSSELMQKFEVDGTSRTEQYEAVELTNPLLNRKLQKLADEAGAKDPTFRLLQDIIAIARNILTQGISLRQLIMLGNKLHANRELIVYQTLKKWIAYLHMEQIAQLEGALMQELFDFDAADILFAEATVSKKTKRVVQDIFQMTEKNAADWYFTQGKSIFVRTNDSDAMMWHVKHSAKYMHYYPSEAVTNFFANFAHSMSHIEE